MSDRVSLELRPPAVTLDGGGAAASIAVSVRNDSSVVDQFTLTVDGVESDWYSLPQATVSLFPGEQTEVHLELRAPTGALAGPHPVQVVATSRAAPSESTIATVALEVTSGAIAPEVLATVALTVAPPRQVVRGRRAATFALRLVNQHNQDMAVRLLVADPTEQLGLRVGPEQLTIPAGGEASATIDARPRRGLLIGQPRTLSFAASALAAEDLLSPPLAGATAELTQQPLAPALAFFGKIPPGLRQRLPLALGALAALALLIWFLAQPGARSGGLIVPPKPSPSPVAAAASPSPSPDAAAKPVAAPGAADVPPPGAGGAAGSKPVISRFGLSHPDDTAPSFLPLGWEVTNATKTELLRQGSDVNDSTRPPKAVEHTQFTLRASNEAGPSEQVFNLYVLRPPRIDAFELEVAQVGTRVRVTYKTTGAQSLTLNGQSVPGPEGALDLPADPAGGEFRLQALNAVGEVTASRAAAGVPSAPAPATSTPQPFQPPAPSSTPTPTPTSAPSSTPVPAALPSPTATAAPSSTSTPASTSTATAPAATNTATAPAATSTATAAPATSTATLAPPTATETEEPTPTPKPPPPPPAETDTPTPTPTPTEEPTPTETPMPTETPTVMPTIIPTIEVPPPVSQGETRLGIDEGFRHLPTMVDTHSNWERIILSWAGLQPNGPGDFSRLGQTITNAAVQGELSAGVKVAGLLQFTPGWAQAEPSFGQRSPPRNLNLAFDDPNNYWGQFVYETVKFYAGRIDEWVIWNEPEFRPTDEGSAGTYTWQGTDAEFAQLLKVAYLAAKKANPNAVVVFPGTSYWVEQNAGRNQFYERVLQILQSDPDAARFGYYHDAAGLNLYRTPDDLLRVYGLFKAIQARNGIDKPVWLTETNAMPTDDAVLGNCNHSGDAIKTTMEEQAAFAVQAYAMAIAADYKRVGFYQMIDANACAEPAVWGVIRDNGTKRPVEDSLRTAITNFLGFLKAEFVPLARLEQHWSPWPDDPNSYAPNWQVYQVALDKPGNQRVTVLWNGDGPGAIPPSTLSYSGPTPPGGLVVRIPKRGSGAHAIDKFGQPYPYFSEQAGYWYVYLKPATATFSGDPPGYHFIGGDPVLIIEDGVNPAAPVDPPDVITEQPGVNERAPTTSDLNPPGSLDSQPTTGPTSGPVSGNEDFRLAVNPPNGLTIHQGEAADFSVNTQALNGFRGPISLRITQWSTQRFPDAKPGDTLPFSVTLADSVTPGRPTTLHIQTSLEDDVGIYFLLLEASGSGITKTIDIALVVDPPGGSSD